VSYHLGAVVSPVVGAAEPLAVQDGSFVRCVIRGTHPPSDGRAGIAVVRALEAAQLSMRQGRTVHLDEIDAGPAAGRVDGGAHRQACGRAGGQANSHAAVPGNRS
jgi:hypothetical protein